MANHPWEDWGPMTSKMMADELLVHGSARARLVKTGLDSISARDTEQNHE